MFKQYTGTVQQTVFSNTAVPTGDGVSPTSGTSSTIAPYTAPIVWNSTTNEPIPQYLQGQTVNEIRDNITNGNIPGTMIYTIDFNITSGYQPYFAGSIPSLTINLYYTDGNGVFLGPTPSFVMTSETNTSGGSDLTYGAPYCAAQCPSKTLLETEVPLKTNYITATAFNQCATPGTCNAYEAQNVTLVMTVNVTLTITCEAGSQLDNVNGFCYNYCISNITTKNLQDCYSEYRNYCLVNNTDPSNINIFNNQTCLLFFKNYFGQIGPNATTDNDLEIPCSAKFPFPSIDAYNKEVNQNIVDICACHLPKQNYVNLRNSLVEQFPGFQYDPEDERCLFPPCSSSSFLTTKIGKVCVVPACINLASVTNNGDLDNSKVTINQSADCANAVKGKFPAGGGGSGGSGSTTEFWDKYKWWIIIGGIVLVVLIIIIIIIAITTGKSTPQKTTDDNDSLSKILMYENL